MARYIDEGLLDCGLTGRDWMLEQNSKAVEVAELRYAKAGLRPVRWVIAVPNDSKIKKIKDLQGKRIATELVGHTTRFLKKHGVTAKVEFSWGRHRGQTAGACGCHRRIDRDGFESARQQSKEF